MITFPKEVYFILLHLNLVDYNILFIYLLKRCNTMLVDFYFFFVILYLYLIRIYYTSSVNTYVFQVG